jgi:hypothetical protein
MAPWISAVAAIIAFIVSGLTFYFTFIRPSRLILTPGNLLWKAETLGEKKAVVIIVQTSFFNDAARPGFIVDLWLELNSYGSSISRRFFPINFVDYDSYSEEQKDEHVPVSIFKHVESPFFSVFLGPKQSLTKTVVFTSRDGLSPEDIKPGRYSIHLKFWESTLRHKLRENIFYTVDYMLKDEHIRLLKESKVVVPISEEIDSLRARTAMNR